MRSARKPHAAVASGYQRIVSPATCEVDTIGHVAATSAYADRIGIIGSWTCTTSNRSRSKIRLMRGNAAGLRTMFASESFAGTITERPTGRTYGGGRS